VLHGPVSLYGKEPLLRIYNGFFGERTVLEVKPCAIFNFSAPENLAEIACGQERTIERVNDEKSMNKTLCEPYLDQRSGIRTRRQQDCKYKTQTDRG